MSQPPDAPRSGPESVPGARPHPPHDWGPPPADQYAAPDPYGAAPARGAASVPGPSGTGPPGGAGPPSDAGPPGSGGPPGAVPPPPGDAGPPGSFPSDGSFPPGGGGNPPGGGDNASGGGGSGRPRLPLTVAVAAAAVLVLGAGVMVTWLLVRDTDRDGAETPNAAVQSFLHAVYREQNAAAAADLVCSEARDEDALATRIEEVSAYEDTYPHPRFRWSEPEVVDRTGELAVVTVTVTLTTSDEQVSEQALEAQVLDKDAGGWWVCDLATVDPEAEDGDESEEGGESGENGDSEDATDADNATG